LRAIENPYDKAYPGEPPRTSWTDWKEDQAHWCRGGIFYQSHECAQYVEYDESKHVVKECLNAMVDVYQDGYTFCSLVESVGCEECMKRFNEEMDEEDEVPMSRNCGLPEGYEDQCCCFADEDTESDGYYWDVIGAVDGFECKNDAVLLAYKIISDPDSCDLKKEETEKEENKLICNNILCGFNNDSECGFDIINDTKNLAFIENAEDALVRGCKNKELKDALKNLKIKKSESINKEETGIDLHEPANVLAFDYSTVDDETAEFLQEKAHKISQMRITFMLSVAKELSEVHEKLANHYKGTFGAWCESIGMSRDTGENYVRSYKYVAENFGNIEDATKIQASVLFAASKPSASKELSDKVVSGDITTHKQYKDLEDKLKESEQIREQVQKKFIDAKFEAEREAKKQLDNSQRSITALNKTVHNIQQQLDQAKRNADPAKVKELGEEISGYQQQIGALNQQLQQTKKQLHDKPIEVPATKAIIPDEIKNAIYNKVTALYQGLFNLTGTEIQIFAEGVSPDDYDEVTSDIANAVRTLNSIDTEVNEALEDVDHKSPSFELKIDPTGCCGACEYADIDKVPEEESEDDKTWCTLEDVVVDFDHNCGRFERLGGRP
jgi:hypothetical protein